MFALVLETSVCEFLAIECEGDENVSCDGSTNPCGRRGRDSWKIDAAWEVINAKRRTVRNVHGYQRSVERRDGYTRKIKQRQTGVYAKQACERGQD